jgi:hypothetical protein
MAKRLAITAVAMVFMAGLPAPLIGDARHIAATVPDYFIQ